MTYYFYTRTIRPKCPDKVSGQDRWFPFSSRARIYATVALLSISIGSAYSQGSLTFQRLVVADPPKSAGVFRKGNAPVDYFGIEIPASALKQATLEVKTETQEVPELVDLTGTLDGKPFQGKVTILKKQQVEKKVSLLDLAERIDPNNRTVEELRKLGLSKNADDLEALIKTIAVFKQTTHDEKADITFTEGSATKYFKHVLFEKKGAAVQGQASNPLHVLVNRSGRAVKSITVLPEQIDPRSKGFPALFCKRYLVGFYLGKDDTRPSPTIFSVDADPLQREGASAQPVILEYQRDAEFAVKNVGQKNDQELIGKDVKKNVVSQDEPVIKTIFVKPTANVSTFDYDLAARNLVPDLMAKLFGKRQPYTIFLASGRISSDSRDAKASIKLEFRSIYREGSPTPNRWFTGFIVQGNQHVDSVQTLATVGQRFYFDFSGNSSLNDSRFRPVDQTAAIPNLEIAAEGGYFPEFDRRVFGSDLPTKGIARFRISLDTQPFSFGLPFVKGQAKVDLYVNPWERLAGGLHAKTLAEFFQLSLLFKTSNSEGLRVSYEGGAKASSAFDRTKPVLTFGLDKKF